MPRRTVATILELADYAEVSAENVLRVVYGEPVSEDVERRVKSAIDALGLPPNPGRIEVLPALQNGVGTDDLLERFQATAAELAPFLPVARISDGDRPAESVGVFSTGEDLAA